MKVSKSMLPTKRTNVGAMIHQASRFSLPILNNSPKEAVSAGTPKPKKSSEVSAKIAPPMRKGKKVMTGVSELGKTWRQMICALLRPKARAAFTYSRPRLRKNSART